MHSLLTHKCSVHTWRSIWECIICQQYTSLINPDSEIDMNDFSVESETHTLFDENKYHITVSIIPLSGFISAQLYHPRPFIQHHITLIWKVSCEKMRKSTQDWQHCTLTLHPLKCTLLLYLSLTANYTVSLVSGFISTWRRIWKIDVSSQIDPPLILITKKNLRQ